MPIAFPPAMGPISLFDKQVLMNFGWKAFNVVPAPNLARPGMPFLGLGSAEGTQTILNPGIPLRPDGTQTGAGGATGNVRRLSTMYVAPENTAKVNPAGTLISDHVDEYNADNRVLGSLKMKITGVSRDATGATLGLCRVAVFRTPDDTLVGTTTSDASGNWSLEAFTYGPFYFVEYKAGSPDVFGTSPNTNVAVSVTPGV